MKKVLAHPKDASLRHRERVAQLRTLIYDDHQDNDNEVARHELELALSAREEDFLRRRTDLRSALDAWLDLKHQREDQGFTLTPHRMVVQVREDVEAARAEWQAEVQAELNAVKAEFEYAARRAREQYDDEQADSGPENQQSLPRIPQMPSLSEMRQMAEERVKNYMKPVEEPDITIKMRKDGEMTPRSQIKSRKEAARAKAVARVRYSVKIYVNQKLVNEIKPRGFAGPDPTDLSFEESVVCHLYQNPDSIVLCLLESQAMGPGSKKKREVAKFHLVIPGKKDVMEDDMAEDEYGFVDGTHCSPAHGGVGSGVQFALHKSEGAGESEEGHVVSTDSIFYTIFFEFSNYYISNRPNSIQFCISL
jgi:hypothetical protein